MIPLLSQKVVKQRPIIDKPLFFIIQYLYFCVVQSGLLIDNLTQKSTEIAVLYRFAYSELRLITYYTNHNK